jgi:hypothetical protein
MHISTMMKRFASLALAFAALLCADAHAVDTFDASTNLLTLQSVSLGGQTFYNAKVRVGSYSQLSVAGGLAAADTFDPATNLLTMGSVIVGGQSYNNVRVHIDSYTLNSVATTPTTTANAVPITVDGGPTGNSVNLLFATATVCRPGSQTQCQVIDHLLLDTGSTGLRILSSVLSSSLGLPSVTGATGFPVLNCAQFLDNSFTWGPLVSADVSLGSNTATNLPIQVIADPTYNALSSNCATGVANDSVASLGAKGVLGIGLFQQDCGVGCARVTNNGIYFTCASATCPKAIATTVSVNLQLQNPAGAFSHDNNGIVIDLPAVGAAGAPSVAGTMYFGIGTQTNNPLASASVLTTDVNGYITTSFGGKTLSTSFIDTGSNGLYFDSSAITQCTSGNLTGFYCPATASTLTATNVGANATRSTVSFSIDSASKQLSSAANTVFPQLAGTVNDSKTFDWGLPFFLGHRVFVGFEGKATGAVTGPFFAY